jgi:hypothetical protein
VRRLRTAQSKVQQPSFPSPATRDSRLSPQQIRRAIWSPGEATGQPFTIGAHDRQIVEQVVRDLALGWSAAPVALELTGSAGGSWLIGSGEPVASGRADAVACMRSLAGRDSDAIMELTDGDETALAVIRQARVIF